MEEFSFSTDMQCSVNRTLKAWAPPSVKACPRERTEPNPIDDIVTFLEELCESTGDRISNRAQINLPLLTRHQAYVSFVKHLEKNAHHDQLLPIPSEYHFLTKWRKYCSNLKTRKHHGFEKCSQCEAFRARLAKCGVDETRAE